MRIVICASDAPLEPRTTGFRRQLTGLRAELAKANDVRLIGYRMPDQEPPTAVEAAEMRIVDYRRPGALDNASDLVRSTLRRQPLRADRLVRGLRQPLLEEIARFRPDVVHVGPGKLAGLLKDLNGLPAVLGVMDTWHLNVEARALTVGGLRKALLGVDAQRIRRFEASQYRGWDRVVTSNSGDRDELRALDATLPFDIIPIGFDASAYAPDSRAERDPSRIIFHGAMNYAPNVVCVEYLAQRVLPRVRTVCPEAHLTIVGRDPSPRVRALEALDGVTVPGEVDDMRAWLTGSRVWAGPFTSGTGIKTKLLEAMATDLPAVVTPLGHRGLDIVSGRDLLVGSNEEELAGHLIHVLQDDGFARTIGETGGAFVRNGYDWPVVAAAHVRLYEEVIAEKAALPANRQP
jgi:glycosyltransferase involved in cell wall biosynthesis